MKIINAGYEIFDLPKADDVLKKLEYACRICYKSHDKIKEGSAEKIIKSVIKSGHTSVIEHYGISVLFKIDRGISHELVRHRHLSVSQTSTRYVNYSKEKFGKEITVIKPFFFKEDFDSYKLWLSAMEFAENIYMEMISKGIKAEKARSVLPQSTATEVFTTANITHWRHILNLRCSSKSHPQIREVMIPFLKELYEWCPILFEDLYLKYEKYMDMEWMNHIEV